MVWFFGDSFDLYQTFADAYMGGSFWDSGAINYFDLTAFSGGRFGGVTRGLISAALTSTSVAALTKSSGQNDAVHHINVAFMQTAAVTGTTQELWLTLLDGTTAQCTISFRSDGTIQLLSGSAAGATVLASYTGAVPAPNTWYSFELEVVIHNTAGSFTVRKLGNTSNDFAATSLNTRGGTANNYANKLNVGSNSGAGAHLLDDLLWRSDPTSVAWAGDIRCYTRMPASDVQAQWTRPAGTTVPITPQTPTTSLANAGLAYFTPFVPSFSGTLSSVNLTLAAGFTGNMKCALYAASGGLPTTAIATASAVSNPITGVNTFTFSSPPSVTAGTLYLVAFQPDVGSGSWSVQATTGSSGTSTYSRAGLTSSGSSYSTFPQTNPGSYTTGKSLLAMTANITPTGGVLNANFLSELVQDGSNTYMLDSTVGDADFYGVQSISGTPSSVVGVITRGLAQKSDAGTRNAAVQLKSSAAVVQSPSTPLNTTWGWLWRADVTDPNTGAAWTPTAVNNAQIGPVVTA